MVKLAAEIVCLWKASSVFPSGKKYQGAGVRTGAGALCLSGSNTNVPVSSHTLLMSALASAAGLCSALASLACGLVACSAAGRAVEAALGLGTTSHRW